MLFSIAITPDDIQSQYNGSETHDRIVVENKGIRLQSNVPIAVYAHVETIGRGKYTF